MNDLNARESRGSRMLRLAPFCTWLVLAGCGGESGQAQSASTPAQDPPEATDQQELFDLREVGVDEGSLMTSAIGIVDFSDFGCIYCANFHVDDYPVLYDEFVASGDVLWKYVTITIGGFPNGDMAGLTGICADEIGQFQGFAVMRDHLFEQREAWMAAPADEVRELLVSYADEVGLDRGAFEECLDGTAAAERLERNNQIARQVGITATPTFIVQGSPVRGAPPLEDFQNVLRRIIAQARGQGAPGEPGNADGEDPGA